MSESEESRRRQRWIEEALECGLRRDLHRAATDGRLPQFLAFLDGLNGPVHRRPPPVRYTIDELAQVEPIPDLAEYLLRGRSKAQAIVEAAQKRADKLADEG